MAYNPLSTIDAIFPYFTVLHVLLIISKFCRLNFKNNPIFRIYVKFAIDWWYRFKYSVKNLLRKLLSKIEEMKKQLERVQAQVDILMQMQGDSSGKEFGGMGL